jgi:hypothetical protein
MMGIKDMLRVAQANVARRKERKQQLRLAELHKLAVKRRKQERMNRKKGRS